MTITRAQLDQIFANQERAVRRAFFEAIAALRDEVRLADLVAAIEAGDTERALAVLNITPATFAPLAAAGTTAYTVGGTTGAAQIGRVPASPGGPVVAFRFGGRSPRAERWAADVSSRRIVEIVEDQRALARSVITSGLADGRNPRSVALDIVGRIDRTTKRRTGGFIGLTEQQGRYVLNLRDELSDPARMANYFTRARRDKRLDGIVSRAMADGVPVKASDIDTIAARYSDRLLQLRGETIARTEAITALRAGQLESMMEAQEQAGFTAQEAQKVWDDTGDGATRPSHRHADGQKVPIDQPFTVGGYRLMYPGDSRMGAPAEETINCFIPSTPIEVSSLNSAIRREYRGQVFNIRAGSGVNLTVTPNHPILTQRGWVAACDVAKGDKVIQALPAGGLSVMQPDIKNAISTAEQLYGAAQSLGRNERASLVRVNLHGEIPTEDVDVVAVNRGLRQELDSSLAKFCDNFTLAETDVLLGRSLYARILDPSGVCYASSPNGSMGSRGASAALIRGCKGGASYVAIGYRWALNAKVIKASVDFCSANAKHFGDTINRVPFIKKHLNLLSQLKAGASMPLGICRGAVIHRGCLADWRDSKVAQAASYNCISDSGSFGNRIYRQVAKCFDGIKERFPLFRPRAVIQPRRAFISAVEVDSVVVSHYEGPVYNFETDSGLIVSGGAISHNCRCAVRYEVDFIVRALRLEGF